MTARWRALLALLLTGLTGFLVLAPHSQPAAVAEAPPPPPRKDFVGRQGTHFVLNGEEFPVAGVNNHYLVFGTNTEVLRVLDDTVAMGANVVRTFLQPVIGSRDGKTVPTIWHFWSEAESSNLGVNGTYLLYWSPESGGLAVNDGDDGLKKLDFLLAEAGKRHLRLIIALLDFWDYTGGAAQMSAWYGSKDNAHFFPTDARTRQDFKTWARKIVDRKNTITGLRYGDDPAIFAWELMNEPNFEPASALKQWVGEMSAYLKEIDPSHLVATGHGNIYDTFSDIAEIPSIDFGTWHGYPIYWGLTPDGINAKIGDFCALGRAAGKPMLFEEFGYARSNPDQVDVYRKWLGTVRANPDCAGWLVWRLVSRQDHGRFPVDTHDQFDVRNDGGPLWQALKAAAHDMTARRTLSPPAAASPVQ